MHIPSAPSPSTPLLDVSWRGASRLAPPLLGRLLLLGLLVGSAALTGCAAAHLARSEAETGAILGDLQTQVDAERKAAREAGGKPTRTPPELPKLPDIIALEDALSLALRYNREILRSREGLVLSAISLRNAQRDVGPRLAGSLGWLLADSDRGEGVRTDNGRLSLTDLLPTGGELELSADASQRYGRGDELNSSADSRLQARLTQPLLRGAGYESSHEVLTDAQRQALYDVRDFDLARQDLALRVQSEYYNLVAQKRVIANRERSLDQFEFLKRRSERLFDVDRVSEVDKFRATREYLQAENDLVDARQEFDARLDRFKILLGLPTDLAIEIADEIPDVDARELDLADALDIALRNRLELMTARDQLVDAERRVRIRERDLLPSLDVEAVYGRGANGGRRVSGLSFDDDDYTLGVSLELPLDRVRERGAVRAARIELMRSRRDLALTEDSVILDVRQSLRNLRSAVSSLKIQEQIAASQEKNAKIARMRFENGEIGNRDLTEALSSLADAQDRLVRERVNLKTAHSQVLRDLGVLVIEEDGSWNE